jgi:hypothetical protein
VIVKDGAAVTKAGGAGNVPEGGDVHDERRRRAKVFGEARIGYCLAKMRSVIAKARSGAEECANNITGRGTISEKFLKEINKRERDA